MALLSWNFKSEFLNGNTEIYVILPDWDRKTDPEQFYDKEEDRKVVWLLHGGGDDFSAWIRKSNVELYACEKNVVMVTFSGYNATFANWHTFADGLDYERFLTDELMPMIWGWLPVSDKREDNFIAGLSMGGAGALKFAFMYPELFSKCVCLSSSGKRYEPDEVIDPDEKNPVLRQRVNAILNAGGSEQFYYSSDNLRYLLSTIKDEGRMDSLPEILISCGEDDHHYDEVIDFKEFTTGLGAPFIYESIPGYSHEWRFWDKGIQRALEFFLG